ncbi:MAG TPA: KTSC domain-containing protein [Candidatus Lachnoclostridium avicola]|nr:KTSC domain-containing protein [Candidatus Lachnoclostridium avicola]
MNMISVSSSNLHSIGWENGILHIRFQSGSLYEYIGVPASIYNGLLEARSHGRFFSDYIKNQYAYKKIG